jgi:osmotically-inducible protein OsmY
MFRFVFKYGVIAGLAAAVAYLFDPENGRRRRAIFRDKVRSLARQTQQEAERKQRYIAGKAEGVKHEVFGATDVEVPNDETVADKIRSEVLRHYDGSRINVNVEHGVAVLRGELNRPDEIRALVHDVERVPGVREVRSLLHTPS